MKKLPISMAIVAACGLLATESFAEETNYKVGLALEGSSALYKADNHYDYLPYPILDLQYKNFYIEDLEAGVGFEVIDNLSISGFITALDGQYISSSDMKKGYRSINKRNYQLSFGVGVEYDFDGLGLSDTTISYSFRGGKHGIIQRVDLSKTLPLSSSFVVGGSVGANFYNRVYSRYYYGVKKSELGGDITKTYRPDASFSYDFLAWGDYQITDHFGLRAAITYEKFDKEVKNSPIVDDSYQLTYILGAYYAF